MKYLKTIIDSSYINFKFLWRVRINKCLPSVFIIFLLSSFFKNLSAQGDSVFTNPILAGFYPDPSICRVDSNYYLVNSTFAYFPGITIFQSNDLVNWNLIGYALDRPNQLNLDGAGVSRGLFAPAIRYHNGIYYITCTLVDKGGNFVVTSSDPAGPWSNPVWIPEINGIDPSLFFDDNGKAYIIYNSVAPDNKPLYQGHRTIRIHEFDFDSLKIQGEEHILINGGTDLSKKPIWIEAPHIFKKDGFYYLICAEGGTAYDHSEVVFKSKNVLGPYTSYENNPILTQRTLDPKRNFPVTSTGHADFVQTLSGDWWAVFLGCRPYEDDYYNTGRETFLAPVKWINGWPVINLGYKEVQYFYPFPVKSSKEKNKIPYSGNFVYKDDFNSTNLNLNWMFLRTPHEKWYDLKSSPGFLSVKLRPETCSGNMNPSFLGHRQQHLNSSASISMNFTAQADNEKAGLLIFQNEKHFYFLCKSIQENENVVQLYKSINNDSSENQMELIDFKKINSDEKNIFLKIESVSDKYLFMFSYDEKNWEILKDSVNAKYLSTKTAGGFVGCMYALYATSNGIKSQNIARFDWFKYKGEDKIYKKNSSKKY